MGLRTRRLHFPVAVSRGQTGQEPGAIHPVGLLWHRFVPLSEAQLTLVLEEEGGPFAYLVAAAHFGFFEGTVVETFGCLDYNAVEEEEEEEEVVAS